MKIINFVWNHEVFGPLRDKMILREKDREKIIKIAKKTLKSNLQILAYGSRVDGTAHDTSDLDLVLRSKDKTPVSDDELSDFKEQMEESTLPILVQAFDWAKIPETFRKNILKNYVILYDSETTEKGVSLNRNGK